jgi:hypothetical protein
MWYGVDPLAEKYPSISPYAYVANNPIKLIDPDGRDVWISSINDEGKKENVKYTQGMSYNGDNKFIKNTIENLHKINATDQGNEMLSELTKSDGFSVTINEGKSLESNTYDFKHNQLSYDDEASGHLEKGVVTPLSTLSHELKHSLQDKFGGYPTDRANIMALETGAVKFANYIRSVYNLGDMRESYTSLRNSFKLRFSNNERMHNPTNEKIKGFFIKQNWLTPPSYRDIGNLGADNIRLRVNVQGIKGTTEIKYEKTYGK